MGILGIELGKEGRTTLMNQISAALGIPRGGWHGQAKLFEGGDVRLRGLLARLTNAHRAQLIADNLARAGRYVDVNLLLVLVSAAREYGGSLTATGTATINTYHQGGLDFLEKSKSRLGLPRSILQTWEPADTLLNHETGHTVYPERIPAHDQLLAYAAQASSSFTHEFKTNLRRSFGDQALPALTSASRLATLVWQAYAFLAPGGERFNPHRKLREQLGKPFGHGSALGYYAHLAAREKRAPSLNDILTDSGLKSLEWFHSAKTRAAETLFLEQLLKQARALLPQ